MRSILGIICVAVQIRWKNDLGRRKRRAKRGFLSACLLDGELTHRLCAWYNSHYEELEVTTVARLCSSLQFQRSNPSLHVALDRGGLGMSCDAWHFIFLLSQRKDAFRFPAVRGFSQN